MSRKNYIIVLVIVAVFVIAFFAGKSGLFTGKLVFFEDAPTTSETMSASYASYEETVRTLADSAFRSNRITEEGVGAYYEYAGKITPGIKITRLQVADLAVRIFNIKEYGAGPTISDTGLSAEDAKIIYLFTSNGGLESTFKPGNNASRTFVKETAANLEKRFSAN